MMNFPTSTRTSNRGETFHLRRNFPTSKEAFQLRSVLSNFARFFPTSIGSFQLRLALSNFSETFQLRIFQLKTFKLLVLSNFPFQLHVFYPFRSNCLVGSMLETYIWKHDLRFETCMTAYLVSKLK